MASKALGPELVQVMKELRLGQILHTLADRIGLAEKNDLPLQDFLLGLFTDEVERRRDASTARRANDAGLDPEIRRRRSMAARAQHRKRESRPPGEYSRRSRVLSWVHLPSFAGRLRGLRLVRYARCYQPDASSEFPPHRNRNAHSGDSGRTSPGASRGSDQALLV